MSDIMKIEVWGEDIYLTLKDVDNFIKQLPKDEYFIPKNWKVTEGMFDSLCGVSVNGSCEMELDEIIESCLRDITHIVFENQGGWYDGNDIFISFPKELKDKGYNYIPKFYQWGYETKIVGESKLRVWMNNLEKLSSS